MNAFPKSRRRLTPSITGVRFTRVSPALTLRRLAPNTVPAPHETGGRLDYAELRRRFQRQACRKARTQLMGPLQADNGIPPPPPRTEFDHTVLHVHLCVGSTGEVLPPDVAKGLIEQTLREMNRKLDASPLMHYPFRPRRRQ